MKTLRMPLETDRLAGNIQFPDGEPNYSMHLDCEPDGQPTAMQTGYRRRSRNTATGLVAMRLGLAPLEIVKSTNPRSLVINVYRDGCLAFQLLGLQ